MNSLILAIVISISSWIAFSTLNELTSANNNCCKSNSCGTSFFDRIFWWSNLMISLASTIFVLYSVYDMCGEGITSAVKTAVTAPVKVATSAVKTASSAVQMVFG